MRLAVWWVEWRLALTRLRPFAVGMVVPLGFVVPLATGAVSNAAAAAWYAVLFTAFAVLGSALSLRWEGERGMSRRIVRGGVPAWSYLLQRAGAGATIDLVQLTPALLFAAAATGGSAADAATAFLVLGAGLWIGGLVGVLVAGASRSLGEAALFGVLASLLLDHASGVFRTPAPGSSGAHLEGLSPFRAVHESLLEVTTGMPWGGGASLLAWAILLPGIVALLAPAVDTRLLRRGRMTGLEGV